MTHSIFNGETPPYQAPTPNGFLFGQRHSPVVEHNVSYTRSGQPASTPEVYSPLIKQGTPEAFSSQQTEQSNLGLNLGPNQNLAQIQAQNNQLHTSYFNSNRNAQSTQLSADQHPLNRMQVDSMENHMSHSMPNSTQYQPHQSQSIAPIDQTPLGGELDEDARFIRLAHDALVATSTESNLIVDPTIQDLLARLRYVLSPHGNPIRNAENIHANENGQLMIQKFYKDFPNLSNDIFGATPSSTLESEPANTKNEGWNFLMDKVSPSPSTENSDSQISFGGRKFPCDNCAMSFHRSSDLKRHEKQHLKIPANICPQCGKGFARKDALKRHLGTLTCKRNASKKLYRNNLTYLK